MTAAFHPTYPKLMHAMLRGAGLDADAVLATAGLDLAQLQAGEGFIDASQMRALIEGALAASGHPWLGLEFGTMAPAHLHGPLGYAAVASASLRQTLAVLSRYSGLRSSAFRLELESRQRDADLVVVELLDMGPQARRVMFDALLLMVARMLESISGQSLAAVDYFLPWPRPAWAAQYGACLGGTFHFDAPRLALRIPVALLDAPCLSADPEAFAAACAECERKLAGMDAVATSAERLRARLRRCEDKFPTLALLAAEQALSPRTLMRRLKQEGTCFQDLLDEVRYERARWHLLHTDAPVEVIAERIGLADTSNFGRSFRRWSGMTPSQFRAGAKQA
jgi:AraC-like DNA-binding protein